MAPCLALGLGAVLAMPGLASRGRRALLSSLPSSSLPGIRIALPCKAGRIPQGEMES